MDKMLGGYQALQIRLLNGRTSKAALLRNQVSTLANREKFLTILWKRCATATDNALATAPANNTLTSKEPRNWKNKA